MEWQVHFETSLFTIDLLDIALARLAHIISTALGGKKRPDHFFLIKRPVSKERAAKALQAALS